MSNRRRIHVAGLVVAVAAIAACNGSGDGATPPTETTTFLAYAEALATEDTGSSPIPLSAMDQAEVGDTSRLWAVSALASQSPGNDVALPPLYFARLQAVVSAASGETLAELQRDAPVPSNSAVAAALVRGISRTVSAGADSHVTPPFMRSLTAASQPGTWAALGLDVLSPAALAAQPNLRLVVADAFDLSVPWPQATVFDGVFEADNGSRVQAPMLRVVGPLRTFADAGMHAVAMAAPHGRWLVRITPTGSLTAWTAEDLASAMAKALSATIGSSTPAVEGEFVLPVLSGFRSVGVDDQRGMQLAQDPVRADLRALDGQGGTFARLPQASTRLNLGAQGLSAAGTSTTDFIFSPYNVFTTGSEFHRFNPSWPVPCGDTELKPAYLALVSPLGGIEMLARFTSMSGTSCM